MEPDRLYISKAMRSSVRGSDKHLLVGIDVAKSKQHAPLPSLMPPCHWAAHDD